MFSMIGIDRAFGLSRRDSEREGEKKNARAKYMQPSIASIFQVRMLTTCPNPYG